MVGNRVKGRGVKRMEEARGLIKKNGARRRGKKQHGQPVGVNRGLKGRVAALSSRNPFPQPYLP